MYERIRVYKYHGTTIIIAFISGLASHPVTKYLLAVPDNFVGPTGAGVACFTGRTIFGLHFQERYEQLKTAEGLEAELDSKI